MRLDQPNKANGRPNRLIFEKSPYLLQHAYNPVDWHPWGEEAFDKAHREDKPIFLSIGYSACHWCMVMERESFEDEEVAQLLNEHFVAIKVDREERPDVDHLYMSACQMMTGDGGWPLTILMSPDKRPFFAGTYFPKESRYGLPGLKDLLERISNLWKHDRGQLLQVGNRVVQSLDKLSASMASGDPTEAMLQRAYEQFLDRFDETYGGFGPAPKFPSPHNLSFLLRWWRRRGEGKALAMVGKTLDAMSWGGIWDHLGFGFHRYSVDERWLVPHFEKMLYDQAMLAIAYIEAYQATGHGRYAEVACRTFEYVLREMTSPRGSFYSSEGAESEGEEGKFYVWTPEEIKAVLREERGDLFCRFYRVTETGNLEEGRSVLHIPKPFEESARDEGMAPDELEKILDECRQELFEARERRPRPSKDDKILTDWNGLMIAALSKGAQGLGDPGYAEAARQAADFLLHNLRRAEGRLLHRYREGEAAIPAFLDDYAFLAWGLLELYEATFEVRYLEEALALTWEMLNLFWDEKEGGLFLTAAGGEELPVRSKTFYDGAVPSGNSVAALNLLRLGRMTANTEFEAKAWRVLESASGAMNRALMGFSQMLIALDFALGPTKEIVIAGEPERDDTRQMLQALWSRFLPRTVVLLHPRGERGETIERLTPFVQGQTPVKGKTTAYVCENYSCQLPTTDVTEMMARIGFS